MNPVEQVTINIADWDGPARDTFPPGWVIVNAPRPISGPQRWTGEFRHGTFYAAGPGDDETLARSWKSDDAWPVVFTDDAAIEAVVLAKIAGYGYASLDALRTDGLDVIDVAGPMGLPWHGDVP